MHREKVTTPSSQNLACLVRLYSGGQWTVAEAKLESSLCLEINRRFPFPLCYFIPRFEVYTTLVFHILNLGNIFEDIDQKKGKKVIFAKKITIVAYFGHSLVNIFKTFA